MAGGVVVGLAWRLVAPLATLEKRDGAVVSVGRSAETSIAADGWFAVCAFVAGVLAAFLSGWLLRDSRLGALAGLTVGGVLGSLVAWRLGVLLGPASVDESAAGLRDGDRFQGPLELSALGVLLAWSTSATIAFFATIAGLESRHGQGTEPETSREQAVSATGGAEPSGPR